MPPPFLNPTSSSTPHSLHPDSPARGSIMAGAESPVLNIFGRNFLRQLPAKMSPLLGVDRPSPPTFARPQSNCSLRASASRLPYHSRAAHIGSRTSCARSAGNSGSFDLTSFSRCSNLLLANSRNTSFASRALGSYGDLSHSMSPSHNGLRISLSTHNVPRASLERLLSLEVHLKLRTRVRSAAVAAPIAYCASVVVFAIWPK
jgi:hypothetical protein